jgi:hypothetical protein
MEALAERAMSGDQVPSADPTTQAWREGFGLRIDAQDEQLISIRGELTANTEATKKLGEKLDELSPLADLLVGLRTIAKAGEVVGKVIGWIGRKSKPIIGWGATAVTLYYAFKNGGGK